MNFLSIYKRFSEFAEKYSQTYYSLILYAALAMLGWGLMWTDAILLIFGLLAIVLALCVKSFNGILGIFGTFLFSIFTSTEYNGINFGPLTFIGFSLLFASFVVFMIKNKIKPVFNANFWGIAALSVVMTFGGFFSIKAGNPVGSILLALVSLAIPAIYCILSSTLTKDGKRYLAKTLMVAGLIICLQMLVLIFRSSDINTALTKKQLWLGWGITNNAGIYLVISLCMTIYLATTSKHPSLYLLAAFIQIAFNVLTFSRASLLILAIIFIPLSIFCIWKTKNRKEAIISYSVLFAVGIVGVALILKYIVPNFMHVWSRGLDGRGREDLYLEAIEVFKENYILGAGFLYHPTSVENSGNIVYFFHNTYLHFLATGGACGLMAVILHKIAQYKPFLCRNIFKTEPFMLFALMIILATGIFGLMDITIWSQHYIIPVLPLMAVCDGVAKEQYPEPQLTKNKRLKSINEVLINILIIALFSVSLTVMLVTTYLTPIPLVFSLKDSIIALTILFFMYLGREEFRALGYTTLLGTPFRAFNFGRSRKNRFMHCHNRLPMYARDMMLVELVPFLMTAVIPAICVTIMGNFYMILACAVLFAASASDILLFFSLFKVRHSIVQDHPTIAGYYINLPEETSADKEESATA